jgi:hypothetical protein
MKKLILSASVLSLLGVSFKLSNATEPETRPAPTTEQSTASNFISVDNYIRNLYSQIEFGKNKLSYDVFEKAYRGYANLKNAGKLNESKNILTVVDFSKSSTENRLWVIDLDAKKLLINDYVAHGQGSGNEFATAFSNNANSHQSSLGFYVTADTYIGKHGQSLRMHGMDKGYNCAAYDRAVVVHGANYVSNDFVAGQKRLGRSWGCPAVSNELAPKFINLIKDRTVLFVYYPEAKYLSSSQWLNNKIDHIGATKLQDVRTTAGNMSSKKRDTVYQYAPGA